MNKARLTSILIIVFIVNASLPASAQDVAQSQTPYGPAIVVNFQQLADYEVLHPVKLRKRFIEQGEDREKGGTFVPQPIPSDAYHFNVQPSPQDQGGHNTITSQAPVTSFNGILDNGTLIPPDIRGAAGVTYVMETTNQHFKVYTKTGTLVSTLSITTFFSATGGSGYFDPHILYDANNSRWVVCIAGDVSGGHSGVFLAISQTNNPTGSWYVYALDGTGNSTDFLDYPLLGLNTNWVVITGRDFTSAGPVKPKIFVFNRANVYSGASGTATTFTDATNTITLAPAHTLDNSQTTEYLVCNWNGNSGGNGYVRLSSITGSASAPVYTAGSTMGVASPWNDNGNLSTGATQSGTTAKIESGDSRIGNAVYINGALWFSHTAYLPASSPNHSAIDWWQVNPAGPTLLQYGRVENSTSFYFYSSISVNSAGDALLGYCSSSSTTFPSASYSFHAASDAANTMQSIYTYKSGQASYNKTFGSGRNRYGDYTGAAVDPSDNSFWNFSEFAQTGNNWGTVIANVAASTGATCNAPAGLTTTAITSTSATLNWNAAGGAIGYNIQYRVVGGSIWTNANTASTSLAVSGLSASTNYEWQVQTVCAAGSSSFTSSATFTTSAPPCNAPTGMNTTNVADNSATFNWTSVAGAGSYNVQFRKVGTSSWTSANTSATSYNASGLIAGTSYEWQVQTLCTAGGSSSFTASTNFTTTGVAPCNTPAGLSTTGITATTATFNWGAVAGAVNYGIQYRIVGGSIWTSATSATTSFAASGLTAATNYEWQVRTNCSSSSSSYTASINFTTSSISYCTSRGNNTTYEYISRVALGTINNTSGNNSGYGNYTALSTNLAGGTSNTITLVPGFTSSSYNEYWKVYIDYNKNGVFTDAGENVVTSSGSTTRTVSFTVPTTALNGSTRMRVQMQYNSYPSSSCLTYTYGEVEDYTVIVTGNAQSAILAGNSNGGNKNDNSNAVLLYPNPAFNYLNVEFKSDLNTNVKIRITDLIGREVVNVEKAASEGSNKLELNTTELKKGVYIFEMDNNGILSRQRFMIGE